MKKEFENLNLNLQNISNKESFFQKTFSGNLSDSPPWFIFNNKEFLNHTENLKKESTKPTPIQKTTLKEENKTNLSKIKVLFVSDLPLEDPAQYELVNKIILAMKLKQNEYVIDCLSESKQSTSSLGRIELQINKSKPRVVITFGASTSNILLNSNEKLSKIHGQFFTQTVVDKNDSPFKYVLCPIFHPSFLVQNPNMKRKAWNDLQKVMKLIE